MIKVKKIRPMFTKLITTANVYENNEGEHGIISRKAGVLKEYQKVVAVGSTVRGIEVGDMVLINPTRYAIKKRPDNSITNDIEGGNPVLSYSFDYVDIDGTPHLMLEDRDIDYVIEDYEEVDNVINSALITPSSSLILPKESSLIL